jgi:hypothetical protein
MTAMSRNHLRKQSPDACMARNGYNSSAAVTSLRAQSQHERIDDKAIGDISAES